MQQFSSRTQRSVRSVACLVALLAACNSDDNTITNVVPRTGFVRTILVADIAGTGATTIDAMLVNPWGITFGPGGAIQTANAGSGTSTSYSVSGAKLPKPVVIPSASGARGSPTGIAFNPSNDFAIPNDGKSMFLFAGEDGTITAWNGTSDSAKIVVDRSALGAVYKGLTIYTVGAVNYLLATDFHNNQIDVFDATFQLIDSFTDTGVPIGYGPFGIHAIDGSLYITFAKQLGPNNVEVESGVGNGFVDVIAPDGSAWRVASNGTLNSPWGVAVAPFDFGPFSGAILVGNFGDGRINAYSPLDFSLLGVLNDVNGDAIVSPGLWGLTFGPSATSTTLYFTAGPSNETHGVLGTLTLR